MTRHIHVHIHTRDYLSGELEKCPVYAHMPLTQVSTLAVTEWARSLGVRVAERKPHVTTAYSLRPVPVPRSYATRDNAAGLVVPPGGRTIRRFGDQIVLCLACPALAKRWQAWRDRGASWDYPDYTPHVTFADLKHNSGFDPAGAAPFDEPLSLMPEVVSQPRSNY